jgi:hypothetical protein
VACSLRTRTYCQRGAPVGVRRAISRSLLRSCLVTSGACVERHRPRSLTSEIGLLSAVVHMYPQNSSPSLMFGYSSILRWRAPTRAATGSITGALEVLAYQVPLLVRVVDEVEDQGR